MIVVLMGVSGSGKTTVGRLLAARLGWPFIDGDDLHPAENLEKMRRGIALTERDRAPWLAAVRESIRAHLQRRESAVVACSALKRAHRRALRLDPQVIFVHLIVHPALVRARLRRRRGHFMSAALVDSQLATLETPSRALRIDAGAAPEQVVESIRARLGI